MICVTFTSGEAAFVEHFADFFERERGVEGVGKERALQRAPGRGVGFDQVIQGLLGFGADQIADQNGRAGAGDARDFREHGAGIGDVVDQAVGGDHSDGAIGEGNVSWRRAASRWSAAPSRARFLAATASISCDISTAQTRAAARQERAHRQRDFGVAGAEVGDHGDGLAAVASCAARSAKS